MSTSSERPIFSHDQVEAYFNRLALPDHHRKFSVTNLSQDDALQYLTVLQKYHLQAVPFENLSLHYSPYHRNSINLNALFKKIVLTPGRGGYCMENNCLLGTLLRSLGYEVCSVGGRVKTGGVYSGWSHMVNLITIHNTKYLVDVGFGGNGPTHPLPLLKSSPENTSPISSNILPASVRLIWKNIEANVDPAQRLWVYQHRANDAAQWDDTYCFTELEFLPQDYEVMNYVTSRASTTIFTQRLMCVKMILGGDAGEEVVGVITCGDDIKWRLHGEVTRREEFKTELDRLKALEEHFGIQLTDEEKGGIRGLVTEIIPSPNGS